MYIQDKAQLMIVQEIGQLNVENVEKHMKVRLDSNYFLSFANNTFISK